MRKLKILLLVFLLLGCILLCGCDLRNYIYTEDSLKKVAEKSLKKKYGEEFIIHDVWERDQTRFFADCSPKDNPKAVFLVSIYKNGGGVFDDEYAEAVVALEVDEILQDRFEEVFGDCYVKSHVSQFYTRPEFESPKTLTLEEYLEATDTSMMCYVFINNADVMEETVRKEYQYLSEHFQEEVAEWGIGSDQFSAIRFYFVDDKMMEKSEQYFELNSYIRGEYQSEIHKYPTIRCYYENGRLDQVYEEYLGKRLHDKSENS